MKLPINYEKTHWTIRKEAREQYIKEQNGLCAHCGKPLDGEPDEAVTKLEIDLRLFPQGFLNAPIHLHHDHNTGMTIGAIHGYCNGVLWQYHGE